MFATYVDRIAKGQPLQWLCFDVGFARRPSAARLARLRATLHLPSDFARALLCIFILILTAACNTQQRPPSSGERLVRQITQASCPARLAMADWRRDDLAELTRVCPPPGWQAFFTAPDVSQRLHAISTALHSEAAAGQIPSPAMGLVFRALYEVPPDHIRTVLIGQDPAPQPGQATGLAFSLRPGTNPATTPSVQRVMLEAANEGFCMKLDDGNLEHWAIDGVLMLNTALTLPCPAGSSMCTISGHVMLWRDFTQQLLTFVEHQPQPMAYILWGQQAAAFQSLIHAPTHHAFVGGHPSPNASGEHFFCGAYFSCSNQWLAQHGVPTVQYATAPQCAPAAACVWTTTHPPTCGQPCVPRTCN